jgi:glucose-6-phosphate 1-dehydrogenase
MENSFNIPSILVLFGSTGDLAQKKLLPSLYNLDRQGLLPDQFRLIAFARRDWEKSDYLRYIRGALDKNFPGLIDDLSWQRFTQKIVYQYGDLKKPESYGGLSNSINSIDKAFGNCAHKIFYLALSPDLYDEALAVLDEIREKIKCVNLKDHKIVVEKPFGSDLSTFEELNGQILSKFDESQVYRIDHYLGKETVQNILYFRFYNPLIYKMLNCENVEKIEVKAWETYGVEGRAGFYDSYGQLKDMVQSHLLQLLALTLMELPGDKDLEGLTREEMGKLKSTVINSLRPEEVIRGQYTAGVVGGKPVKAYIEEEGIPGKSNTETFVRLDLKSDLPRWRDSKITITTGKRLIKKKTEIVLTLKGDCCKNQIFIRIQPDEGIQLKLNIKSPDHKKLEQVLTSFKYKDTFQNIMPDAYEQILLDIVRNKKTNFATTEELEAAWKFIDSVDMSGELKRYPAGVIPEAIE